MKYTDGDSIVFRVDIETKMKYYKLKGEYLIRGKRLPTMSEICRTALLEFINSHEEKGR